MLLLSYQRELIDICVVNFYSSILATCLLQPMKRFCCDDVVVAIIVGVVIIIKDEQMSYAPSVEIETN